MKISTKRGDKGESGLYNGKRLKKNAPIFGVLGDLDELQSFLGILKCALNFKKTRENREIVEKIMDHLYDAMALIGNEGKLTTQNPLYISELEISFLEENIEKLESEIGEIHEFVRPGKNEISSRMHVARAVCRRAERSLLNLKDENHKWTKEESFGNILKYINRLSDLLFLLAVKF